MSAKRIVICLDGTWNNPYYDIGVGSLVVYPGAANLLFYRTDRVLGGGSARDSKGMSRTR